MQVGKPFVEVCAISAYAFTMSCILFYILKWIPGMQLRVHVEAVIKVGLDWAQFQVDEQMGERAILDELVVSSSTPAPARMMTESRAGTKDLKL